ncbi:winged helix DNA-binding domain-containing protein [Streptomyces polygonati]|uniref:Winged helix DNA-binding domain-containing protein n=1 Tax=Streptomyces polygonati TaxID=1617087 RepID=A0ABV8HUX1_9ACTN
MSAEVSGVRIGVEERRARLRARQLAAVDDVAEVVEGLVALHATDPATVFLSVAARLCRPSGAIAAVEEALYGSGSGPGSGPALVRMMAMRRTMFVVSRESAPDVFAAAGRDIAARERTKLLEHLARGGGWDAAWLAEVEAEVEAALDRHGESGGARLSALVPRLREQVVVGRGKPYETTQNVASRVIRVMAAEYRIERRRPAGSWTSGQFRWARAEPLPERPVGPAREAVVRAWLRAYGPGTEADLKWWTGWTLTEVRKALKAVGAETVRLDDGAGHILPGHILPGDTEPAEPPPPGPVLLPGLDPTPMGWQDRDWFLPRSHRAELFDGTGNVGPTVWWGGEVIGGWAQRADGSVVWRQLTDRGAEAAGAVDRAAAELVGLLGGVRITPRFRTPLERELSA